jgi:D-glycero-alpha-D-manno-heptose-7-phosphate kinase
METVKYQTCMESAVVTAQQTERQTIIQAKAPLRISFAGGGTDISPYPENHGGCVLSCSISKYSHCTLMPRDDEQVNITSLDYNLSTSCSLDDLVNYDGKLDLVKAAINVVKVNHGLDIVIQSDVPPGAGLGASSSMTVALAGALSYLNRLEMSNYNIAELAYWIEREEAGIKGGKQDQYAAAFGGLNMIEFLGHRTIVSPLAINPGILDELRHRLVLCYTGKRRLSAGIIDAQVKGYMQHKDSVLEALDQTKKLVAPMKNALLCGDLDKFGLMLHNGWMAKKQFSDKITDPDIDDLYNAGIAAGALGGKLLGAGGGGYILFFCARYKAFQVAQKLEKQGSKIMNFNFDLDGLRVWEMDG